MITKNNNKIIIRDIQNSSIFVLGKTKTSKILFYVKIIKIKLIVLKLLKLTRILQFLKNLGIFVKKI